ncbi:unnamed protein product [Fraxinus pennsylvanica]|uniref:SWIM-type domain-containing protein n=1 Tax=Fraxinus pennsylvanica TaxID=56036 RepID=A0AAD2AAZ1_9LAMI|nr:unnamed protein product [Fraxinus pennsylvanica]
MYAPYISEDLRLRVLSLLYVGVSVETIMQRHNESVERQGGPSNRDDLLTHRYVRRQERSIRRSTYELDADDAVSISIVAVAAADPVWKSKTHGLRFKYPIHSLVVFNSDNKAIPVAWIISPRFARGETHRWMRALLNRVCAKDPSWKLAGFIVDDPLADVLAIREVFECSVLICFWRVRHAWHKNLLKRCSKMEVRAEIAKRLGPSVNKICKGSGSANMFKDVIEDFADATDFMDYFKANWYPRLSMWESALKTLPLASLETCAAMEFYHNQLKLRLLNEKDQSVYQRADWLVNKLGTKVHSYFWLDEYSGKDDFARYWKDEWMSGLTAWRKSLKIPDPNVVMERKYAKIIDWEDQDTTHIVWNPGSEYAFCDCSWAKMGNLCEHVFKIIKFCRDKGTITPSISMFQYNQALINMLRCPPFDSLIRDHSVSLAVWLKMQLNELIGPESCQFKVNPIKQQISKPIMDNQDRELVHKDLYPNGIVSSHNENGSALKRKRPLSNDMGSDLLYHATSENVDAGMEVHSSSNCTSAPQLIIDRDESTALFSQNGYILGDAGLDIEQNLTSRGAAAFNNPDGSEDDTLDKNNYASVMELEPLSIDDSLSTTKFLDRCANICQLDESKGGTALPINSDTRNAEPKMNNSSPSASRPVHFPLDITEASGDIKENGAIDLRNVNAGTSNGLASSSCILNADSEIDRTPSVSKSVAPVQMDLAEGFDVVEGDKKVDLGNECTNMTVDIASLDNAKAVDVEHNTSGDIVVHDARTDDTSAKDDICTEAVGDR